MRISYSIRPFKQNYNEVRGFEERARYLVSIAGSALETNVLPPKEGFKRHITREPLGVVLVIAPWNYPYLCMVNSVVPALLAGKGIF
jgi:acyl-CoA reductase-like NAD-dependent aldehyde dehydrogenase